MKQSAAMLDIFSRMVLGGSYAAVEIFRLQAIGGVF